MKTSQIILALFIALLTQTTFIGVVTQRMPVDLVLIVVVFAALTNGPSVGLWTGTFSGMLQDILSGGVIGVSGLAKTITGVLVGFIGSQFILGTIGLRLIILVLASIVHALCYLGVYALIEPGMPIVTARMVGLQAILNAVVGVAALAAIRVGPGARERFRRKRRSLSRRWIMSGWTKDV